MPKNTQLTFKEGTKAIVGGFIFGDLELTPRNVANFEPPVLTKVVIPMVKPTLAVLAVFTFIGSWGEFLWPSIMLTKDAMYTLPVGINNLQGMFSSNWRFIAAGSIISTIPIIVFFLMMQRYFISGENDGAVKG